MRVIIVAIFLCSVFVLMNGCGNGNTIKQNDNPLTIVSDTTSTDTLNQLIEVSKKDFDIIEVVKKKDTLSLVIASRNVYYPFGKLSTLEQLQSIDPAFEMREEFEVDAAKDTVPLIRLFTKGSFIKFYKSDETNNFEIVSAKISDVEVNAYQTIHLGVTRDELLQSFFNTNIQKFTKGINVIEVISGVTGLWQYYQFKDNKLVLIKIDSDYTFKKD